MRLGGLQKFSLIDYPRKVAAVIFTQGCNFRCAYCHNAHLVLPERFQSPLLEEEVFAFLRRRQGQLQAVVVSGGEPTYQKDLLEFLRQIKCLGYLIKLDTNGSRPEVLKQIFAQELVDYVAMDVKAPLDKYGMFTQRQDLSQQIKESIDLILHYGKEYHFRTTYVKSLLSKEDIDQIKALISHTPHYCLQSFVYHEHILDPNLQK